MGKTPPWKQITFSREDPQCVKFSAKTEAAGKLSVWFYLLRKMWLQGRALHPYKALQGT